MVGSNVDAQMHAAEYIDNQIPYTNDPLDQTSTKVFIGQINEWTSGDNMVSLDGTKKEPPFFFGKSRKSKKWSDDELEEHEYKSEHEKKFPWSHNEEKSSLKEGHISVEI